MFYAQDCKLRDFKPFVVQFVEIINHCFDERIYGLVFLCVHARRDHCIQKPCVVRQPAGLQDTYVWGEGNRGNKKHQPREFRNPDPLRLTSSFILLRTGWKLSTRIGRL